MPAEADDEAEAEAEHDADRRTGAACRARRPEHVEVLEHGPKFQR
jgi:hypothetical protein